MGTAIQPQEGSNVTCLVEYQNYRTVVPKELGKAVSAVTDTKLLQTDISALMNQ
jgi:hypothetical protein